MTREKYYNDIYCPAAKDSDIRQDQKLAKIFKSEAPSSKVILDIGCGPGVTLKSISKENKVFGIDLVDEYLKMAKTNGYYETIKCDVENGVPFEASSVDIVVCTDLLEHIFQTEYVAKEIYRVVKDGGYAILNVPNHNELERRLKFLLGQGINVHRNFEDWRYPHIRFFTWNSWGKFLREVGFRIIEFYPSPSRIYVPIPHLIKRKFGSSCLNSSRQRYDWLRRLYSLFSLPIPGVFARRFPNLFSYTFLVKVVKRRGVELGTFDNDNYLMESNAEVQSRAKGLK